MAKVFDGLVWDYLICVLQKFGLNSSIISLQQQYCMWPSFSIVLNVTQGNYFASRKGLRQEDPLSSILFIYSEETLSR